jgi:LuxR family transcriptional regulator, maltose regulon positive regulatory protein
MTEIYPRLLATKTRPPRRVAGLIDRPRLLELLCRAQSKLLTVIKAAAGFGKTCLAASWAEHLQRSGHAVAWLSIDAGDDEPAQFLYSVAHVLRRAHHGMGDPAIDLIREISLIPPHTIVTTLINDLADLDEEAYLFLDDYQAVVHRGIHDAVGFLLTHAPSNFHLISATRTEPPLPLARLRSQNQLLEVDTSVLRFDLDEMRQFLAQEQLGTLQPAELAELLAKTEGWPAVMRIVASTCGQDLARYVRGLTGEARPIGAYISEMLEGLPDETYRFMLRTCILNRLSAALCHAVTGAKTSHDLLVAIEARQLLLLPLDTNGVWYRYHPLLRDHLHNRLEAEAGEDIPELHRRAARWYAEHELWTDAVQHAMAAGDTAQAIGWIEIGAMPLVKRGDLLPLLGWQRLLPGALMRGQLKVRLAIAWGLALAMRFDEALRQVAEIERDPTTADFPDPEALECECLAIRAVALALKDDSAAALPVAEASLKRKPGDPSTFNGVSNAARFAHWKAGDLKSFHNTPWLPFSEEQEKRNVFVRVYRLCLQGLVELQQMRVASAERTYLEAMRMAEQHVGPNAAAAALPASLIAQIRYDQGRLQDAEDLIIDRMPIIDATGMLDCVLRAYLTLARVAFHRGNTDRVYSLLDRAENLGHARQWGRLVSAVLLERLRLHVAEGRIVEADASLTRLERLAQDHPAPQRCAWSEIHDHAAMARAVLAAAGNRARESVAMLQGLHQQATAAGLAYRAVRLSARLSVAQMAAGESGDAANVFRGALRGSAPAGLCQPILDAGPEIATLLRRFYDVAQRNGAERELLPYVETLMERCREPSLAEPTQQQGAPDSEGLSPRERSVLALLSKGLSNKDIARALSIAPETVKSHVKHIFCKLGVERRTQAVSRALSLGLARAN